MLLPVRLGGSTILSVTDRSRGPSGDEATRHPIRQGVDQIRSGRFESSIRSLSDTDIFYWPCGDAETLARHQWYCLYRSCPLSSGNSTIRLGLLLSPTPFRTAPKTPTQLLLSLEARLATKRASCRSTFLLDYEPLFCQLPAARDRPVGASNSSCLLKGVCPRRSLPVSRREHARPQPPTPTAEPQP
ncbi:hypothetical protein ABIA03_002091 [Bradyrhizobium yuanmingense]|uniref:Uncharacterized protein n=1 Tax=Bradyrhizobium yuanmingense TaxID=108015 RepID=A0ABV4GJE1_9BRAD